MIQMKYSHLVRNDFTMALQKLARLPLPVRTAYQVKKILEEVQNARKKVASEFTETILKKYAKKDEKGEFVRPEGDPNGFMPPEQVSPEMTADEKAFGENVFKSDRFQIHYTSLGNAQISAQEIEVLEPLLEFNGADDVLQAAQSA